MNKLVSDDFHKAEATSLPVMLIILVLAFGSLVAACVPLVLGFTAVLAALGVTELLSHLLHVEVCPALPGASGERIAATDGMLEDAELRFAFGSYITRREPPSRTRLDGGRTDARHSTDSTAERQHPGRRERLHRVEAGESERRQRRAARAVKFSRWLIDPSPLTRT